MVTHLLEIVAYLTSRRTLDRVVKSFVSEQIERSGERDAHFASVWLVNWLNHNKRLGYSGPETLPEHPCAKILCDMIARSPELSSQFVVSESFLDYAPGLSAEMRKRIENVVPEDWLKNADV